MQDQKGNSRLADLLQQVEAEGAQVKQGGRESSALTRESLSQVAASPEFEAWISWSKAI